MNQIRRLSSAIIITVVLTALSLAYVRSKLDSIPSCPVKVVYVAVAADEEFQAIYANWQERLYHVVHSASEVYEELAGIRLIPVQSICWNSPDNAPNISYLYASLPHKEVQSPASILLGFTGQVATEEEQSPDVCWWGMSFPFTHCVLVRDLPLKYGESIETTALRELGRALGMHYTTDLYSFMCLDCCDHVRTLDSDNLALLRITRQAGQGASFPKFSKTSYRQMMPIYRRFLRDNPDDPDLWVRYGLTLKHTGETEQAIRVLQKAAGVAGHWNDTYLECVAHYNIASTRERQKRFTEAVREYSECVRLDPKNHKVRCDLGNALAQDGEWQEAERELLTAHEHIKDCSRGHFGLGRVYMCTHRDEEAERELREAIRLAPQHYETYLSLAGILIDHNRLEEAVSLLRKANRLKPNDCFTLATLSYALYKQGSINEAERTCHRAMKIDPRSSTPHSIMSRILFEKKDYAGAWREVKLCRKYDGKPSKEFICDLAKRMPEPKE